MTCPHRRMYRIPSALRKVRAPMRSVMMKKWPNQPRRDNSSATCNALRPPSSKVSSTCRPGAVRSIAVTSSGRSGPLPIASRCCLKAARPNVYAAAPGRGRPDSCGWSATSWYANAATVTVLAGTRASARQRQLGAPSRPSRPQRELGGAFEKPEPITEVQYGKNERERRGDRQPGLPTGGERACQRPQQVGDAGRGQQQACRLKPGAHDRRPGHREHEGGWDQLPERHHEPELANHEGLRIAVLIRHTRDLSQRGPRVVVAHHVRYEQDSPAALNQPGVELAVLVERLFVEQAHPLERLSAATKECDGIDPARFRDADAEEGVPNSERVRHPNRDRSGHRRLVGV